MMRLTMLAPLVLLAACEPADNEPGPGGVTVGEAKALDDAAEMLEQRRLAPEALGTGPEGDEGAERIPPEDEAKAEAPPE